MLEQDARPDWEGGWGQAKLKVSVFSLLASLANLRPHPCMLCTCFEFSPPCVNRESVNSLSDYRTSKLSKVHVLKLMASLARQQTRVPNHHIVCGTSWKWRLVNRIFRLSQTGLIEKCQNCGTNLLFNVISWWHQIHDKWQYFSLNQGISMFCWSCCEIGQHPKTLLLNVSVHWLEVWHHCFNKCTTLHCLSTILIRPTDYITCSIRENAKWLKLY